MSESPANGPPAIKDPDAQHAIAGAWRPILRDVVRRFVAGDYGLARGVPGVEPVSAASAEQIHDYLSEYGATLVELPDDTWQTSVAQWMEGHWDILVDLWQDNGYLSSTVVLTVPPFSAEYCIVTGPDPLTRYSIVLVVRPGSPLRTRMRFRSF